MNALSQCRSKRMTRLVQVVSASIGWFTAASFYECINSTSQLHRKYDLIKINHTITISHLMMVMIYIYIQAWYDRRMQKISRIGVSYIKLCRRKCIQTAILNSGWSSPSCGRKGPCTICGTQKYLLYPSGFQPDEVTLPRHKFEPCNQLLLWVSLRSLLAWNSKSPGELRIYYIYRCDMTLNIHRSEIWICGFPILPMFTSQTFRRRSRH